MYESLGTLVILLSKLNSVIAKPGSNVYDIVQHLNHTMVIMYHNNDIIITI